MTIDFDILKNADPADLVRLRNVIDNFLSEMHDSNFVEVTIINREGRTYIDRLRKAFPDLKIEWHGEHEESAGEFIITVPGDKWNEDLKAEISKHDSFVGHHKNSHIEYRFRDGVEIPSDIKDEIDWYRRLNHIKEDKPVVMPKYWLENHGFGKYIGTIMEPVEIVTMEWDDELIVTDRRKYASIEKFKNISIEL